MARLVWCVLGLVGAAVVLSACHGGPHLALTVDSTKDVTDANPGDGVCATAGGLCTVRAAIAEANAQPATTVTDVEVPTGTYTLGSPLVVTGKVTLTGTGTATLDGFDATRVLEAQAGAWLGLTDLTITGGNADQGAGLLADGLVALDGVTLHDNQATTGGGAISVGPTGTVDARNTTVSDNRATTGGGIRNEGDLKLRHATVTANSGGGIATDPLGTTRLLASVVADQTSGTDCTTSTPDTDGSNLDSDGTCLATPSAGDQPGAQARLAPLQDNGGLTPTHLPAPTSDALDAIAVATAPCDGTIAVDQRDTARPQQGGCDAGAVEALPAELSGADCGPPPTLVPGADLRGCDLTLLDLSGADLTGADLAGATLLGADLTGTVLTDADLTGVLFFGSTVGRATATYSGAELPGADLSYLNLRGKNFDLTNLRGADLGHSDLDGATLYLADLSHAQMVNTVLDGYLFRATLAEADLTGAAIGGNLGRVDLTGADLTGADLLGVADINDNTTGRCTATYTGATVGGIDLDGCDLSGTDLTGTVFVDPSLVGTDLSGADLTGASLTGADLTGAILTGATLGGVDLTDGTLVGVVGLATLDLTGVGLMGTDLSGLDLTGRDLTVIASQDLSMVDLSGATVTGVDLTGLDLTFADFSMSSGLNTTIGRCTATWRGTIAKGVDLAGCDLSGANLASSDFAGGDLTGTNLTGATISEAVLTYVDLSTVIGLNTTIGRCDAYYTGATIPGIDFSGCKLNANLIGTDLTGADMTGTDLRFSKLNFATITNVDLLSADVRDVTFKNASGLPLNDASATYGNTTCADDTNSDANGPGFTCVGHWLP